MKFYYLPPSMTQWIDLNIVRLLLCDRRDVYDPSGRDYLGTEWTLAFQALYSPQTYVGWAGSVGNFVTASGAPWLNGTSGPGGPDPLNPTQGPPNTNVNSAPWTDVGLRHKLSQPRGQLKVTFNSGLGPGAVDEQIWVASPWTLPAGQVAVCDPANGPFPQVSSVTDVNGDGRTFFVAMSIKFTINDCRRTSGPTAEAALLSNQWTASLSYDEQYLSTRTISGMAIFRADLLHTLGLYPDQVRLRLLPPRSHNCKRYIDELVQHPDGVTYSYTVRDVEQAATYLDRATTRLAKEPDPNAKPRNCAYFDIDVERRYEQVGTRDLVPRSISMANEALWAMSSLKGLTAGEAGGGRGGSLKGQVLGAFFGDLGEAVGDMAEQKEASAKALATQIGWAGAGLALAGIGFANEALPQFTETITVTCLGNRFARMSDLQYLAFSAAFGQVTTPIGTRRGPLHTSPGSQGADFAGLLGGTALAGNLVNGVRYLLPAVLTIIPTASIYNLRYSPTKKLIQFTLVHSYGGLVDWVTGGTAGGWRAITSPVPDSVIGGDWPQSAVKNYGIVNNVPTPQAYVDLPDLPDKGKLIASPRDWPGIAPPIVLTRDGRGPVMGTNLTNIIAQDLLGECGQPQPFTKDWTYNLGDGTFIGPGYRPGDIQLQP